MITTEFYATRDDGVKLYLTYSDAGVKILQNETDLVYDDVIDVENAGYTYSETDIQADVKHEPDTSELEEILDILLGDEAEALAGGDMNG